MTQQEKDILIKDLSARLLYGVKVNNEIQGDFTLIGLTKERIFTTCEIEGGHNDFPIELIKPYLFPMSSMTEEEISDLQKINSQFCFDTFDNFAYVGAADDGFCSVEEMSNILNYLNSHHFDYHGLIEKGLAIKVIEENNPYNITEK